MCIADEMLSCLGEITFRNYVLTKKHDQQEELYKQLSEENQKLRQKDYDNNMYGLGPEAMLDKAFSQMDDFAIINYFSRRDWGPTVTNQFNKESSALKEQVKKLKEINADQASQLDLLQNPEKKKTMIEGGSNK